MEHGVDRPGHVHEVADVVELEHEPGSAEEVVEVLPPAGEEVVDGHHLVTAGQQRPAQVGAEEPGPAGDDDPPP